MAKSEYLQREEAAKKQLGTKGVKKRVKQLPTAARAFTREIIGKLASVPLLLRAGVNPKEIAASLGLSLEQVLEVARSPEDSER